MRPTIAFVCALAVVLPAVAAGTEDFDTLVTLRVQYQGHIAEVQVVAGQAATVGKLESPDRYYTLTPEVTVPHDGKSPVRLQLAEVTQVGAISHTLPVENSPLRTGRISTFLRGDSPLDVELVETKKVPPNGNLRPIRCCITCDGVTVCGSCIDSICGRCCVR